MERHRGEIESFALCEKYCFFIIWFRPTGAANIGGSWSRGDNSSWVQSEKVYIRFGFVVQTQSEYRCTLWASIEILLMHLSQANITIIDNWIPNEISSTLIRLQLRRNLSVKYLLSDEVISYIQKNSLYGFDLLVFALMHSLPFFVILSMVSNQIFKKNVDFVMQE